MPDLVRPSRTLIPWEGMPYPPRQWQAEALPRIIQAIRAKERPLVSATMGAGKSELQAELGRLTLLLPRIGNDAIVYTVPRKKLVHQLGKTLRARLGARNVGLYFGGRKQADRPVIVCCNASIQALHGELATQRRRVALMVCDEAHSSEGAVMRATVPEINPRALVGFTATPFRSVQSEALSLFSTVAYRYTIRDAVDQGVLVPPDVIRVEGMDPGDTDPTCLDMIREHAHGPGIVSSSSIADAERYARYLSDRGFLANAIHSKLADKEQERLVSALLAGDVSSLVHVSLLAEGVDMPALRWLCLRRKVQARVRFLQEVGRVLRTMREPDKWGPKTKGIILDPHLLLGRHGWTTVEAIGEALDQAAEAEERDPAAERDQEQTEDQVVALDLLLAYLERAVEQMRAHGILPPPKFDPGGWALADVSQRQVDAIRKAKRYTRHIPDRDMREAIKALAGVPWALTRGQASLLLAVLFGGSDWCRAEAAKSGGEAWRYQWPQRAVAAVEPPGAEQVRLIAGMGRRK